MLAATAARAPGSTTPITGNGFRCALQLGQRRRGGRVARDDEQLDPAAHELVGRLQRVAQHRILALRAIRHSRGIAEVDRRLVRQLCADRAQHGEPADARVEHTDRQLRIDVARHRLGSDCARAPPSIRARYARTALPRPRVSESAISAWPIDTSSRRARDRAELTDVREVQVVSRVHAEARGARPGRRVRVSLERLGAAVAVERGRVRLGVQLDAVGAELLRVLQLLALDIHEQADSNAHTPKLRDHGPEALAALSRDPSRVPTCVRLVRRARACIESAARAARSRAGRRGTDCLRR